MDVPKANMTGKTAANNAPTEGPNPIDKFKQHIDAFKLVGKSAEPVTRSQYYEAAKAVKELIPVDYAELVTDLAAKGPRELLSEAIARYPSETKPTLESFIAPKTQLGMIKRVSDLFEKRPVQFGLRGDFELWKDLEERFEDMEMPNTEDELRKLIEAEFEKCTKHQISEIEDFHLEKYDRSGMSTGWVVPKFWAEKAIPFLLSRFQELRTEPDTSDVSESASTSTSTSMLPSDEELNNFTVAVAEALIDVGKTEANATGSEWPSNISHDSLTRPLNQEAQDIWNENKASLKKTPIYRALIDLEVRCADVAPPSFDVGGDQVAAATEEPQEPKADTYETREDADLK